MSPTTPESVATITGVTVDQATVMQAQAIVELAVSADLSDLSTYGASNRFWLSRAVAYQAAWMPSQPDLFSRTDVTSLSQDGASFTTRDANSLTLAPLAQKALSRVSWLRSRTVLVRPGRQSYLGGSTPVFGSMRTSPVLPAGAMYTDDDNDPGWTPVA